MVEKRSNYFVLHKRRGHGESKGFGSLLVGTFDSVFDTKPAPYRILHQTPNSEVSYGKLHKNITIRLHYFKQNK